MEIIFAQKEQAVRTCECKSKAFQIERVSMLKTNLHIYTCASCGRTQYRYPDGTEHQPEEHPGTEFTDNKHNADSYTRGRNTLKSMVAFMFPLYYYPNNVLGRNGVFSWFTEHPAHVDIAVYFWCKKKRNEEEKQQARIHTVEVKTLTQHMQENPTDIIRIKRQVLNVCNERFPEYRFYQSVPEIEHWGHMNRVYRDFKI